MKTLADGTEVSDDTPTRNTSEGRFLLTAQEIARKQAQVLASQKERAATQYKRDRIAAYMNRIGTADDQLDMIWKALEDLGSTHATIAIIAAIKSEFPKP